MPFGPAARNAMVAERETAPDRRVPSRITYRTNDTPYAPGHTNVYTEVIRFNVARVFMPRPSA